jgi:hypothetical protein
MLGEKIKALEPFVDPHHARLLTIDGIQPRQE